MRSRSETSAALVAVAVSVVLVVATCLPFLLTGTDVPGAVVLLGRYLPALASAAAVLAVLGRGHLARLWRLQPLRPRELLASYGLALAVMLPALVAPALLGMLLGAELRPTGALVAALPVVVVGTALFALSTVGEEVLWRGQLQSALRRLGFWWSSVAVGVTWTLWHVPLQLTYLSQGTLSGPEVVASTLGLVAWAPLLAALVERRGTIWPAVFAHAVPLSSLQLLSGSTAQEPVVFWSVTTLSWAALLGATLIVRRRRAAPREGRPESSAPTAVPRLPPPVAG